MRFADIASGTTVFVDANVFVYAFAYERANRFLLRARRAALAEELP